ncbi:serine hydrolase domain-containing protein [Bradyrhizobium glycinis]|uniref:serine hydrolase domain-containing protein n=1 Tax=Bradyrhizobium glycinis TaxID=2751812 RepID=UPI0018D942DF|nr:serine hydrolase [Bradyrhizobium glycinis]MBH5366708.1 serine hydrolase [Bradyrhizobium glycinis]
MKCKSATIGAFLAVVAIHACATRAETQESQASVWPTNMWEVSTPEEQGMDSRAVARLIDDVGTYKQDSVLIVRNGKIVADAYFAPYVAGIRHDLRSVTKSFLSTVIGVLVQQGKLESVDRPVLDFFPDRIIANLDDRKKAISVQNLLDMASGIDWVERVYTPDESLARMYASPDPTGFVLDQPMSDPPGEKFYYKGGDTYLLSALVNKLTGQNALDYARKELFAPLGITDVRWAPIDKQGIVTGEAGMRLTPHDMAKLGYLYLRDGLWDGKRIIPSAWVDRARSGKLVTNFGKYANLWWSIPERDVFMALGRHGQAIVVFPRLDVIAVLTGVVPDNEKRYPVSALIERILGAVRSDRPLAPDPEGEAALKASLLKAATEKAAPLGTASELVDRLSSKTWRFADNKLRIRAVGLKLAGENPTFELTVYPENSPDRDIFLPEPVGLDGRTRTKRTNYAVVANRGNWQDSQTFALERRFLGNGEMVYWTFRFEGDQLNLRFRNTDGYEIELRGEPVN